MEKYTINGYAVEYDTFDLDEIERWDGAIQAGYRVKPGARSLAKGRAA